MFIIQRTLDMKGGGEESAFDGSPNSEWYSRSSTLAGQGSYRRVNSISYILFVQSCWSFLNTETSATKSFQKPCTLSSMSPLQLQRLKTTHEFIRIR